MFADIMLWQTLVSAIISCFMGVRQRLFVIQSWDHLINHLPTVVHLANQKLVSVAQVKHLGSRLTQEEELVLAHRAHEGALAGAGPGYEGTSLHYQCFARLWNAIVNDLHQSDRISRRERDELSFRAICSESLAVFTHSTRSLDGNQSHSAGDAQKMLNVAEFTILPTMILSPAFVAELWESKPTGRYSFFAPSLIQVRELSCWLLIALGIVAEEEAPRLREDLTQVAIAECRSPEVRNALVLVCQTLQEFHRGCCDANRSGSNLSSSYASELQEAIESLLDVLERELRSTIVPVSERREYKRKANLESSGMAPAERAEGVTEQPITSLQAAGAMAALQSLRHLLDMTIFGEATKGLVQRMASPDACAAILSLCGALCTPNPGGEPRGHEASRQLLSFANSMFHKQMAASPSPVQSMRSLSALTPYYKEDVSKSLARLQQIDVMDENASTLQTLAALFPDEWTNMLERTNISQHPGMMVGPLAQLAQGSTADDVHAQKEIARWAAGREQTLSRTVHGVMRVGDALRLTARLEGVAEDDIETLVATKFEYVVSAQVYHALKQGGARDPVEAKENVAKASGLEALLETFPYNLRVAYIIAEPDGSFYSALMRGRPAAQGGGTELLYKVKLPGNPIVGEGKPENQNHAIIFARGQCLQTLDMNQDGYLGEAFKMRNLLEGFTGTVRLIGFRENIFSHEVGTVGAFAASNEFVFATMTQRFLSYPLY